MNKDLELLVEGYRQKLLEQDFVEEEHQAILSLSPEELLLLIHENLNIERMIDGYLVDCLMKKNGCKNVKKKRENFLPL